MEAAQERVAGLVLIWLAVTLPVTWWLFRHPEWISFRRFRGGRHRHPGHPDDCPLCRQVAGQIGCPDCMSAVRGVEPWHSRKSRRGRKKVLETEGVACLNPAWWQVEPALLYGQLHKIRKGRRLKYAITQVVCGTRERFRSAMRGRGLGFSGLVQTAYVERFNLFLRETVAPLSRRTWSQAQTEEGLSHHLHWSLACYHLVKPHEALRVRVGDDGRRYRPRTPAKVALRGAMAAGISTRPWTIREILNYRLM